MALNQGSDKLKYAEHQIFKSKNLTCK